MSIKTNELQQITAPQGSDSLLLDTAAAGTGRLTLAQAAQFFDQKLLQPGTQISASLSQKAALSAQQTVEKTSVASRTVEVTAADLASYIAALPRLLTENLTITVSGGTCSANGVYIQNFYGSGSLAVNVKEGEDVICPTTIQVIRCSVPVDLKGFRLEGESAFGSYVSCVMSQVFLSNFMIDGANKGFNSSALQARYHGFLLVENSEAKNNYQALNAQFGGTIVAYNVAASGNTYGATSISGGIVFLAGSTSELVGGTTNAHWGGAIFNKDGEII